MEVIEGDPVDQGQPAAEATREARPGENSPGGAQR